MQYQGIFGRNYELKFTPRNDMDHYTVAVHIVGDFWPHESDFFLGLVSAGRDRYKGFALVTVTIHNAEFPAFYVKDDRLNDALQFFAAAVDAESDRLKEGAFINSLTNIDNPAYDGMYDNSQPEPEARHDCARLDCAGDGRPGEIGEIDT